MITNQNFVWYDALFDEHIKLFVEINKLGDIRKSARFTLPRGRSANTGLAMDSAV